MKKGLNYLMLLMFSIGVLFMQSKGVSAAGNDASYVTISNVTYSSASVDWSGIEDCVIAEHSDAVCSDFEYTVIMGDRTLAERTTSTSMNLTNLAANTNYFVEVYCYYTQTGYDEDGELAFNYTDCTWYDWNDFITGELLNVDDGSTKPDTGVANPSTGGSTTQQTPSTPQPTPQTQNISLVKPKVASATVVDGTLYLIAEDVDGRAEELEWAVYDRKTNKCVKTSTSYSTAETIYNLNSRKIYYVRCRAVGTDSNYDDVYSDWSDAKYFISQPKITSKNKDVKKNKITIKWKKISGVKNYTIYAKKGNAKKWTKVKTTNSNKYVLKKLKGKKINTLKSKYYFTVVANATINGKKVSSGNNEYTRSYTYYY